MSVRDRILFIKKNQRALIVLCLIAVCIAAFGRIAGNGLIYFDDNIYVTENPFIQSGFSLQSIAWAFTTTYFTYWHPVTWLSHMLDWRLFGANLSGHHLVSLLVHIGAVIFFFLFLCKTTKNIRAAAFAAALFAVHPLRVESVAWAAERKDVLCLFFGMASLYAYAFYAEDPKLSRYVLSFILFVLSLMSKPLLVTLPFLLLLMDYWPLGRWEKDPLPKAGASTARLVAEKIPFLIVAIGVSILTVWAQTNAGAVSSLEKLPFLTRLANAVISYVAYLGKIFWPVHLAVFYPYEQAIPLWKTISSGLLLAGITAWVLYYARKLPFLLVGWFWYLGTFVPVIGLIQAGDQAMADRHTYLPSAGIMILLVWGAMSFLQSKDLQKKILLPAGLVIIVILAALTWQQCGYWKNGIVIWDHTLRVTPNNALAYKARGTNYDKLGLYERAIADYDEAIRLNPNFDIAYYNRGVAYDHLGREQRAIADYTEAIRVNPNYQDAYNNRGVDYLNRGDRIAGCADARKACALGKCRLLKIAQGQGDCR